MSGGYFEYQNGRLKTEMFGYTDKPHNVLEDRELSELTWDLLELIHIFDLYKSADTSKKSYLKAKNEFKKKWFSNRGVRVKRIVDEAIDDLKLELYQSLRINEVSKDEA